MLPREPSSEPVTGLVTKFSNAQIDILQAYLDTYTKYTQKKDKSTATEVVSGIWKSLKQFRSTNRYLLTPNAIKLKDNNIDAYKQRLRNDKSFEEYRKFIVDISNDAKDAREAGNTSMYAMCLYALRTRFLHELTADNTSALFKQYQQHIDKLLTDRKEVQKKINFAKFTIGNLPNPKDVSDDNDIVIELAQLGHLPSIEEAFNKMLLGTTTSYRFTTVNLLRSATDYYTPIQPHHIETSGESKATPLPVILAVPMEFQPNLYCWLPHYLSNGDFPKSRDDFDNQTKEYNDDILFKKASIYKAESKDNASNLTRSPKTTPVAGLTIAIPAINTPKKSPSSTAGIIKQGIPASSVVDENKTEPKTDIELPSLREVSSPDEVDEFSATPTP